MSQAYHRLELEEASKKFTTIHTLHEDCTSKIDCYHSCHNRNVELPLKVLQKSASGRIGYAILPMRPNTAEAAVDGCLIPARLIVCMHA